MIEAVLSCLSMGVIPTSLISIFIALFPKVKSPTKVSEFRHFSLCNIVYKLVSKVVANRMRGLLPLIISKSESAFQSDKAFSVVLCFNSFYLK